MLRTTWLVLLCSGLFAQTQQPSDPSTLARVEGRVTNSVTGEPLRKAEVQLTGAGEYSAIADGSGHFVIDQVSPGAYNLTAQHQNFAVQRYGATRPGLPGTKLSLSAGQQLTNIELKLTPFGVISGKVVDEDGDPVTGVSVTVMKWQFSRNGRQLAPSGGGGTTNDRGEYRIFNLPSGRFFLVARPIRMHRFTPDVSVNASLNVRNPALVQEQAREEYATTFYPSAPDVTSATPVVVAAGQETSGRDLQLRKSRVFSVQGRVAGFQKGQRISLSLMPAETSSGSFFEMNRSSTLRQEDGSFAFRDIAPGRYSWLP